MNSSGSRKLHSENLLPTFRSRGQQAWERIQHGSVTPHGPPRSPPQTKRALRDHCTMLYFPLRVEQTWKAPLRYHHHHHIHSTNLLLKVPKLHRPASTSATWVVLPPWLVAAHQRRSPPESRWKAGGWSTQVGDTQKCSLVPTKITLFLLKYAKLP